MFAASKKDLSSISATCRIAWAEEYIYSLDSTFENTRYTLMTLMI